MTEASSPVVRVLPAGAVLPALPASVPRRAYPGWLRALGRWTMRRMGWRYVGGFADAPRQVLVAAPHTSNWDGIIGLAAAAACGVGFSVFAKRQLFRGPVGWLLRLFGGVPVDRDQPGGLVGGAVERLRGGEARIVAVTPEGTRAAVDRWKSGWHRMAVEAGVPVAVAALDWGRKQVGIVGTIAPSGNYAADLGAVGALLAGVEGKHPERGTRPPSSSEHLPEALQDGRR